MKTTILNQYIKDMYKILKLRFPELNEKELVNFLKSEVNQEFKNHKNDGKLKITYESEGIVERKSDRRLTNLYYIDNYLDRKKSILNGYGTSFKRHDEHENILAKMIDDLKSRRKFYKKKMFEHLNDEDQTLKENYDSRQKTTKILNNSFYGATAEANSIFYHPHFGPSVTYAGEDLVTIAAKAFESFLGNNILFETVDDVFIYINNIMNEEYATWDKVEFNDNITKEILLDYFKEHLVQKDNFNYIEDFFELCESKYKNKKEQMYRMIYYKNNFKKFLENTDINENYFSEVIGNYEFLDPNEPPEDVKPVLDEIWSILKEFVFYNYQDFYRFKRIESGERRVVLTVDTDSNFLYLYPYFEYFKEVFPDKVDSDKKESVVNVVNTIMYQMTELVNKVMLTVTGDWNISEEFGKLINMKNEFLIKRMMLTSNKKNYASIILMQEGHIIDNPKVDIKGLAIRKVNTNRYVREYFTKLLGEEILFPEKINLSSIIYKYKNLETEIYNSLLSGSTKYSIPGRANEPNAYKFPERIMPFRGAVNWNIMFPDQEISLPEKINMFKLNIESFDEIQNKVSDKEEREIFKLVFKNKNGKYVSNGFDVISIPKKESYLPNILLPFIDIDSMVNTNIQSGIVILESLGFKTLDILTSQFTTNILKM